MYGIASFCCTCLLCLLDPFITLVFGNEMVLDFPVVCVCVLNFFLATMRVPAGTCSAPPVCSNGTNTSRSPVHCQFGGLLRSGKGNRYVGHFDRDDLYICHPVCLKNSFVLSPFPSQAMQKTLSAIGTLSGAHPGIDRLCLWALWLDRHRHCNR